MGPAFHGLAPVAILKRSLRDWVGDAHRILVADLASGTGTADSAPGLKSLSGEFYVKGE